MKILVAGGGTGGHIIPNIALLDNLKTRLGNELEVLYIGSKRGMEAKLIPEQGWNFKGISCGKMRRYFSWENFLDFFRTLAGIIESLRLVLKFNPDVIFCKGGYVSFPVAVAGGILGKPVIIHESDVELGLANRLSAKFARIICFSYEESRYQGYKDDNRVIITGNPVRTELSAGKAELGRKFTNLSMDKPVILVMGGSQGSQFINALIEDNLQELLKDFQIVHICGQGKQNLNFKKLAGYFSTEYIGAELKDIYAMTDLIISRAGANSLAEIAYLGLPAILIPLIAGSRGDQIKNAQVFAQENLVSIVNENEYKGNIIEEIKKLLKKVAEEEDKNIQIKGEFPSTSKSQSNNAAEKITDIIINFNQNGKQKN